MPALNWFKKIKYAPAGQTNTCEALVFWRQIFRINTDFNFQEYLCAMFAASPLLRPP